MDLLAQRMLETKLKEFIKDLPVDRVGPDGTKWYIDPYGTDYARNPNTAGVRMPRATVYIFVKTDGAARMCLIEDDINRFEGFQVHDVGREIDRINHIRYINSFKG